MTFKDYFASKLITLCFLAIGTIVFSVVAIFADVSGQAVGLCAALLFLLIVVWLSVSYLVERRKIEKLEALIQELPEKYLLGEVLPPPTDLIERRYYEVIKQISRSAVDIADRTRREKEEYCAYVESWIHEIKTPLTACSLILANGGDVRKLKAELKRADNLTESILYYARMRTAEKDMQVTTFNVAGTIEEAVKSQMELMIAARIRVETSGGFMVSSDSKALCFIIKQLLMNTAKYCPGCLVRITALDGVITVEDDGIGIPAHELRRVMDRGFTGTNGRKLGGSTGMGLYIVHEWCEQLNIDIQIASVQGRYTKITLAFRTLTKL
jgi:signal transduction histidine kinase